MKRIEYPDWVEMYRSKGKTIRKVRNGYGLYKCTSVYVKGMKYPKSKQEYLGMIIEKDGFIPKSVVVKNPEYIEYGLSHFIYLNFKREIKRNVYSASDELIKLGIVYFVFNSCNEYFINHCYLTINDNDDLISYKNKINNTRIITVTKAISRIISKYIDNTEDLNFIVSGLKLCVIEKNSKQIPFISNELKQVIERNNLKYDS